MSLPSSIFGHPRKVSAPVAVPVPVQAPTVDPIAVAVPVDSTIQTIAPVVDSAIYQPTPVEKPAVGQSYTDPSFGTVITRITDAANTDDATTPDKKLTWIENEYSTACPFNADNSRLILVHQSYFGLYDGNGRYLSALPFEIGASSEPRWDRSKPDVMYYHTGNALKSYKVSTGAVTLIRQFREYVSISAQGESDISEDSDHLVLIGDGREIFLYTISTDTKGDVLPVDLGTVDAVYVSPDNQVTVTWNRAGFNQRKCGVELFDGEMQFIRQLCNAGGHMHMCRDFDGASCLIWTNSNDPKPTCGSNAIVKVRLSDGVQTCLLSLDWSLAVHVSAADRGYAFVETYNPVDIDPSAYRPFTNELLRIKLDGTEVRRLAHHRSRPFPGNTYNYMPKLSASRDGSRLVYASNFGIGEPLNYADEYLMRL